MRGSQRPSPSTGTKRRTRGVAVNPSQVPLGSQARQASLSPPQGGRWASFIRVALPGYHGDRAWRRRCLRPSFQSVATVCSAPSSALPSSSRSAASRRRRSQSAPSLRGARSGTRRQHLVELALPAGVGVAVALDQPPALHDLDGEIVVDRHRLADLVEPRVEMRRLDLVAAERAAGAASGRRADRAP